mmetsp:Transcript_3150/g.7742  ORF Transcript_3150/g.7742 Transcript_3150/m.7742 type:complete len:201 (+) Transcript_3150:67-669(+)
MTSLAWTCSRAWSAMWVMDSSRSSMRSLMFSITLCFRFQGMARPRREECFSTAAAAAFCSSLSGPETPLAPLVGGPEPWISGVSNMLCSEGSRRKEFVLMTAMALFGCPPSKSGTCLSLPAALSDAATCCWSCCKPNSIWRSSLTKRRTLLIMFPTAKAKGWHLFSSFPAVLISSISSSAVLFLEEDTMIRMSSAVFLAT